MRTTIVLPDGLLKTAKKRAEELGVPLSGLIAQALRGELERPVIRSAPKFKLVVNRKARLRPGHDWSTVAARTLSEDANSLP